MDIEEKNLLTPSQFTFTLVSSMIGTGVLTLPNDVIKAAKQDGWISCIIGGIYPIYIFVLAYLVSKRFPKSNLFVLSKKCFGKLLGNIFNVIFISYCILEAAFILSGFGNVFRIYAAPFLRSYQVILPILIVPAFISFKSIVSLGRFNKIIFYLTIFLVFMPIGVFKQSSVLNIMPIGDTGIVSIMKGAKETAYSYSGIELIFLLYPLLEEKKKFLKCSSASIGITIFVYTWVTFLAIFYLGIDISPKFFWPTIALADSINIPIINSFRFIFISFWALVMIKGLATYYYASCYTWSLLVKRMSKKTFAVLIYLPIAYIAMRLGNPTLRGWCVNKTIPYYVAFNIIFLSVLAFLCHFKKGDISEKN